MKYYLACDIKQSTLLWKHMKDKMLEAFLREWLIICEYLKSFNSYKILGQYGDEWHIEFDYDEQLSRKIQFLLFLLIIFVERPIENTNTLTNKTSLFRFGFGETLEKASSNEASCKINNICGMNETGMSEIHDFSKNMTQDEKEILIEIQDTMIKFNPIKNIDKINVYYIFSDILLNKYDVKMNVKNIKSKNKYLVKYKVLKDGLMVSYICHNKKDFNYLVNSLKKYDSKICGIYGNVYKIKNRSILLKNNCFCNKQDVYGNVVNVCAKEFIKLEKNEKKFVRITKDEFDNEKIILYNI